MLKKSLLIIGITILLALLLYLVFGIAEKIATKKEAEGKIKTLPTANLFTMDSTVLDYSIPSTYLFIYFNSECEYCQSELRELKNNIHSIAKAELILMSSESISAIKKTSENFGLNNEPNIRFAKINSGDLFNTFGPVSVPHIFIYGKDRKLIKEFKGETTVKAILKYIQ